jgi:uncharacterized protein YbaP (TraB family)
VRIIVTIILFTLSLNTHGASIWHVEGEQEFYLFGTIHVLRPDAYPLPSIYNETLKKCDSLHMEVDLDELNDKSVMLQLQKIMLLPTGEKLKDQMSADAYKQLELLASKANVPLGLMQGLKPWAAANQLTLMIFQQKGFTGEGLDMYLHAYAKKSGLTVDGFETLLWQLSMFDDLSNENTDDFVEFSTEDISEVDVMVEELYRNWQQGNYKTLYKEAKFDEFPQVEKAMLSNRNQAWMSKLLNQNKEEVQCVAVGLLHMAASHGLIAQFEKNGYRITQLK